MVTVSLRFTAGRYSATPWGHQVNEGLIEWPPSPWRLLRALVAVWRRTLPNVAEKDVAELLHALAALPQFGLPRATEGHSRHYMPLVEGGQEIRSLIFDAFVVAPRDCPVVISWPDVELSSDQQTLFSALLDGLPYFGRAESWCRAELHPNGIAIPEFLCQPLAAGAGELGRGDFEIVRVLTADPTPTPASLMERLAVDTGRLRQERRDPYRPPGSRWVNYARPREALSPAPRRPAQRAYQASTPEASDTPDLRPAAFIARYAISGAVRPQALRTVDVAEAARRAVMSQDGRRAGTQTRDRPSCRFSGKDGSGRPLRGHRHAFYLPADEDGDGFLDHLNISLRPAIGRTGGPLTQAEFTESEARSLENLRELWGITDNPLRLVLLHLGGLTTGLAAGGMLGMGNVWESVTPFMLPRHPKPAPDGSGWRSDSPEQQLRRELAERFGDDIATNTQIEPVELYRRSGHTMSWQAFRRWRSARDQPPPYRIGLGARLTFPVPLQGPIALGYGCHFGLGQFRVQEGA